MPIVPLKKLFAGHMDLPKSRGGGRPAQFFLDRQGARQSHRSVTRGQDHSDLQSSPLKCLVMHWKCLVMHWRVRADEGRSRRGEGSWTIWRSAGEADG